MLELGVSIRQYGRKFNTIGIKTPYTGVVLKIHGINIYAAVLWEGYTGERAREHPELINVGT